MDNVFSLKDFNNSTESCESLVLDRPSWCQLIIKGAHSAETCSTLGQSHQHQRHSAYPLLPYLWGRLPCPDWPYHPFLNTPLVSQLVIFDYKGWTTPNKTARNSEINIMQTWRIEFFFCKCWKLCEHDAMQTTCIIDNCEEKVLKETSCWPTALYQQVTDKLQTAYRLLTVF